MKRQFHIYIPTCTTRCVITKHISAVHVFFFKVKSVTELFKKLSVHKEIVFQEYIGY